MTRDRWIQGAVALGLLALTVWIVRHTYWDEVTVTTPPTGEAARNPYYAVMRLARDLGVRPRIIGSLHSLPLTGIVLVNSLGDDLRHGSIESLQAWVQGGGRLIIRGDLLAFSEPLRIWSGIRPRSHGPDEPAQPHDGPLPPRAVPVPLQPRDGTAPRPHGIPAPRPRNDCRALVVDIDGTATGQSLTLCDAPPGGFISDRVPSWSLSDAGGIQVLRVPIGRGELTVVGPYFTLSNAGLRKGDHARIFVEAAGFRHGDRLDILSPTRAEPLLALLWRLAAPAIVLLSIAALLMIIRHLPRFGPAVPMVPPVRRSLAEQIRANARFAWRTRKLASLRTAIRRALDEVAQKEIVGYGLMAPGRRAAALGERTGIDAAAITAALLDDSAGGVNEDRAAITLLEACRRILIDSDSNRRHHA